MTWRDRLRAVRMDVSPLRESRDFRLLLVAGTVFYLGGMVSYVAIPFQVYRLTGSNLAVGAIGLAELVPILVFGLWGGALADHVDRRRLLVGCGVAQVLLTSALAVNAFRGPAEPAADLRAGGAAVGVLGAAAAQPRGADAAHRTPRPDHRGQRAVRVRDAGGRAAWGRPSAAC